MAQDENEVNHNGDVSEEKMDDLQAPKEEQVEQPKPAPASSAETDTMDTQPSPRANTNVTGVPSSINKPKRTTAPATKPGAVASSAAVPTTTTIGAPASAPDAVAAAAASSSSSSWGKQRTGPPSSTPGAVAIEPSTVAATASTAALSDKNRAHAANASPASASANDASRRQAAEAVEPEAAVTTSGAVKLASKLASSATPPASTKETPLRNEGMSMKKASVPAVSTSPVPPSVASSSVSKTDAGQHAVKKQFAQPAVKSEARLAQSLDRSPLHAPAPGASDLQAHANRNIAQKLQAQPTTSTSRFDSQNSDNLKADAKSIDGSGAFGADLKSGEFSLDMKATDVEKGDEEIQTEVNLGMIQPPTMKEQTYGKKEDEQDLAIAVPVTPDEHEKVIPVDVYREEYIPIYRRWTVWVVVCVILVLVGVAVGVAVALSGGDSDGEGASDTTSNPRLPPATLSPTLQPTASPTSLPTSGEVFLFKQKMIARVTPEMAAYSRDAFDSAVEWLYNDPLNRRNVTLFTEEGLISGLMEDDNMQRFILAWLWFHSTNNGQDPWVSCNPPDRSRNETDLCGFYRVAVLEREEGTNAPIMCYAEVPNVPRWLSQTSECTWPGIICDPFEDVVSIRLLSAGVRGTFPVFLNQLEWLQQIQFSYGGISGTFPEGMQNFVELREFTMIGHVVRDPIPASFFSMPNLEVLNLGLNKFKGTIPRNVGDFARIRGLYLQNNAFEGPLPDEIGNLRTLEYFGFHENSMIGHTLPASWGNLTAIQGIFADNNGLEGSIPEEWSQMRAIQEVRLTGNALVGPLPDMSSWSDLQFFYVQRNSLSGRFPEEFFDMRELREIDMSDNGFTGSIPDLFRENTTGLGKLEGLALNDNSFTGTIPSSLANLEALVVLRLHYNLFDDPVPSSLCDNIAPSGLSFLEADCGGDVPNECSCCTACCDREARICQARTRRRRLDIEPTAPRFSLHLDLESLIPRTSAQERSLQANDCDARYRWNSENGFLEKL